MLTLTERAADKIRQLIAEEELSEDQTGLRVQVVPGGCSGFQYGLGFDEQAAGDIVFQSSGVTVLVDEMSAPYLEGATFDYTDGLQGAGFAIDNPNATSSCGCGKSFT
jgi:iron-sulfur cluster assembly accessory protein